MRWSKRNAARVPAQVVPLYDAAGAGPGEGVAVYVTGMWNGLQVEVYDDLIGRVRLTVTADRDLVSAHGSQPVQLTKWSPVPPPDALQQLRFIRASGRELRLRVSGTAEDLPRYLTAAVAYARALSAPPVGTGARLRQT